MATINDDNLEAIIDSCVIETKEKLNIKDFEEMEREQEDSLIKSIYEVRNDILENKRAELKMDNSILRKLELSICILKKIDGKFNKTMAASMSLFFLLGIFIGIQHETWIPYIGQLIDVAKAATNVIK